MIGAVYAGTTYHAANLGMEAFTGSKLEDYLGVPSFVDARAQNFSILKNALDLITVKRGTEALNYIDRIKMAAILLGLVTHCTAAFETPLGFYVAR